MPIVRSTRRAALALRMQAATVGAPVIAGWAVFVTNAAIGGGLIQYGVVPRTVTGLRGILFAPFLHGSLKHIAANTIPFLVLGWLVLVRDARHFISVTLAAMLGAGLMSWLLGASSSVHIGASGVIFGYLGFLGIILQGGLIGRLVKRFGEGALVMSGFVTLVFGYFGLGLAASGTFLLFAGTLAAYGNGVIRPALTSLITQQAGRQEQGVVLGITQALMSMASIVAPVVGGFLIQRQMLSAWAWCAAALAAVGVFVSREANAYATAAADSMGTP